MAEKRYQVFISSTYRDLVDERQNVMQTIMQMDCIPAGMELFPAADEEQFQFIKRVIDDCDYYLLILGGRYGSLALDGLSYTEKEYDYAVEKGIKVVAFVHADPGQIVSSKTEEDADSKAKLEAFRQKVRTGRLVREWKSAADLPGLVSLSMSKTIKTYPAPGWVRGGATGNPELLEQINNLRREADELKERLRLASDSVVSIPNLAQGNAPFGLRGSSLINNTWRRWNATFSWDQIFYYLGPHALENKHEDVVKATLSWAAVTGPGGIVNGAQHTIDDDNFQTVKVQLLALGLVDIRQMSTTEGKTAVYWIVTPVGRKKVLELRSVKVTVLTPPTVTTPATPIEAAKELPEP